MHASMFSAGSMRVAAFTMPNYHPRVCLELKTLDDSITLHLDSPETLLELAEQIKQEALKVQEEMVALVN